MSHSKFDLLKAKRDLSKLVKVQRVISRGGKVFTQHVYISPDQVKSTDKVVGGQQVYQNYLNSKNVPKPAAGVLDKAYFDAIKSDKKKALDYLKSCGLSWKEDNNLNITWMRAMMVYNNVIKNQNTTSAPSQVNPQTQTKTLQPTQNTQQGTQVSMADTIKAAAMINQKTLDDLKACKNGREKTVVLKRNLGIDKCLEFAKLSGVQWNESDNTAINVMRMSMALTKFYDDQDGTVSPTKSKGGKVGAPDGNQNAKKDTVDVDNPTDNQAVIDPDKVEIPDDATESQKNLINKINEITDQADLEFISKVGMVPEDDDAKNFIQKMFTSYQGHLKYDATTIDKAGKNPRSNVNTFNFSRYSSSEEILQNASDMFKGISKRVLSNLASYTNTDIADPNLMYVMTNPRDALEIHSNFSSHESLSTSSSFETLFKNSRNFNEYARRDLVDTNGNTVSCSAAGYAGRDSNIYESQYDVNKEGYVKMLRHISSEHPELSDTVESMVTTYDTLMKKCRCNPSVLLNLLRTSYSSFKTHCTTYNNIKTGVELLRTKLENMGISKEDVDLTIHKMDLNHTHRNGFKIYVYDAATGTEKLDPYDSSSFYTVSLNDFKYQSGDLVAETFYENFSETKNYTRGLPSLYDIDMTEDDYNEILKLAHDLMGVKVVDKSTNAEPTKKLSEYSGWSEFRDLRAVPDGEDEKKDAVIANMICMNRRFLMKKDLERNVMSHSIPSKANSQGLDYRGNFNYYIPSNRTNSLDYFDGHSFYKFSFNTADEEHKYINDQLSQNKTYSLEYFNKLKEYVDHEGDASFKRDSWGGDFSSESYAKASSCSILAQDSLDFNEPCPAKDLLMDDLLDISQYCPQNFNTRVKTKQQLTQKIFSAKNYIQYNFKKYIDKTSALLDDTSTTETKQIDFSPLRKLREAAVKYAKCSLARVDDSKRQEVEHDVKMNFDRINPKTGKRVHKGERVYDDRTMVFHSGVYEIKNSRQQEELKTEAARLNESVRTMYHGTSYGGALGVTGIDGRFRYKRNDTLPGQSFTGTMLGEGIYVAKMVGKTLPYIGIDKYSYTHYTANDTKTPQDKADGILMVCDTVLGNYKEFSDVSTATRNNKNSGGSCDSVAVGAGALMMGGSRLREYECIVTRNNMIAPKYLVDCGGRRR